MLGGRGVCVCRFPFKRARIWCLRVFILPIAVWLKLSFDAELESRISFYAGRKEKEERAMLKQRKDYITTKSKTKLERKKYERTYGMLNSNRIKSIFGQLLY